MAQHVFSQLACLGTRTITGLLTTCGQQFSDWSADYRMYSKGRVESDALFASVRQSLCDRHRGPVVIALDDTRLPKAGKKTHGVKYMRDAMGPPFHTNLMLAPRFLQISMASSEVDGHGRMIPVDWVHAPIPQKPRRKAAPEEIDCYKRQVKESRIGVVATKRLDHLRKQLNKQGQGDRKLWAAVDGGFTNKTVLKNLPENTSLVGRIRSDAKLYHLPCTQHNLGRQRSYGERAPTPEELRRNESTPWQEIQVFFGGKLRTLRAKQLKPVRWRVAGGDKDLQMIVLAPTPYRLTKTGKLLYRKPAYLICTDPDADLRDVIQYYLWRWDIEVNFRDEKSILGVGEAQVRTKSSVQNVTACAVAAYAMLLTAATKIKDGTSEMPTLPPPKWHRRQSSRVSTMDLIKNLRNQLLSRSINFSGFALSQQANTKPEKLYFEPNSAMIYASNYS